MPKGKAIPVVAKDQDFFLLDSTFFCYGKNHKENLEYHDYMLETIKKIGNIYIPKAIFIELKTGLNKFNRHYNSMKNKSSNYRHKGSKKTKRRKTKHNFDIKELQDIIYKEHKMLDILSKRHKVLEPTSKMKELYIQFKDEIETIPKKKHELSKPDISLLTNSLYLAIDNKCGMLSNDVALEDVAFAIASENETFDLTTYFQSGKNIIQKMY